MNKLELHSITWVTLRNILVSDRIKLQKTAYIMEKAMASHSTTLVWKIPWTEEPVGYNPWGCKESDIAE